MPPAQSWKNALFSGPGPRSKKEFLQLYAKAFAMGTADLIPGVSGGTIAFISGIYRELLAAIASADKTFFTTLLRGRFTTALDQLHTRFLAPLVAGILSAIFLLARLMHYLMQNHAVLTWSAFFGLIAGSTVVIFKQQEEPFKLSNILSLTAGAITAWIVVGLIPITTPETLWFIFLCGIIATSAMILPGLSGSFLLLILGKYEFITGIVKNPFQEGAIPVLLVFATGSTVGVLSCGRLLNHLLKHYYCQTMAFLTGVLLGSIKKVWPWREVLESKIIRGKIHILREANALPAGLDGQVACALGLILLGFATVLLVEFYKARQSAVAERRPLV